MNEFSTDLAWADQQLRADWWGDVYRRAWPDLDGWHVTAGKTRAQENGVDHVVSLGRDKDLRVEVKCRRPRRDGSDWPDVLLETHSCWERKTPGWIEKPLTADFFAYAFVQSRIVLLLPVLNLQAAWRANRSEWDRLAGARQRGFAVVFGKTARNGGGQLYSTRNIAVPTVELGEAVKNSMRIPFGAECVPAQPAPVEEKTVPATTEEVVPWRGQQLQLLR